MTSERLFGYKYFRATTKDGGSVEFHVERHAIAQWEKELPPDVNRHLAHEAWRALWQTPAKNMLKAMCDKLGAGVVHAAFLKNVKVEELSK